MIRGSRLGRADEFFRRRTTMLCTGRAARRAHRPARGTQPSGGSSFTSGARDREKIPTSTWSARLECRMARGSKARHRLRAGHPEMAVVGASGKARKGKIITRALHLGARGLHSFEIRRPSETGEAGAPAPLELVFSGRLVIILQHRNPRTRSFIQRSGRGMRAPTATDGGTSALTPGASAKCLR